MMKESQDLQENVKRNKNKVNMIQEEDSDDDQDNIHPRRLELE